MADAVNLQYQVKQNNEELQDFLKDLYKWEEEVQARDKLLVNSNSPGESSHPVRNKARRKKPKSILKQTPKEHKPKLKGSDFKEWDKYDVDEALKEIDQQEELETQSTSDEDSEDEEIAEHRRLQQALFEKEKGNDLFKEGKYEAAINRYTTAISLDPHNAILPANRAMALIKMQRYGAAIQDCDTALELDNTYIKAYARRATAKHSLRRLKEALEDYEQILTLQPENKQALDGIEKIKKMLAKQPKDTSSGKEERQTDELPKKPMKRYLIEEIGSASSDENDAGLNEDIKNKDDETETLIDQSLPNQAPVNQTTSMPVKTIGENTAYSSTVEDRNHSTKPASTEEDCSCKSPKDSSTATRFKDSSTAIPSLGTKIPSTSSCNGDTATCDLVAPSSSIQFQATWKRWEKNPDVLYSYMKMIPPEQLPKVMGESVESSFLMKIFTILRDFYVRDCRSVFNELKYISQVKRFSMTLMFLSAKEKSVISDLFDYLGNVPENEKTFTEKELQALKLKYDVR